MKASKPIVRNWMKLHRDEYIDKTCNELNCTQLAEAAAQEFELYEDDAEATIPDWVFDEASNFAD